MTNSWEGFLDIIGLALNIRQRAKLKILMDFPNGEPKELLLLTLFDHIEKIYEEKRCTILWWNDRRRIYSKILSEEDMIFLQYLWYRKAGDYLLFLPEEVDVKRNNVEDDEEFIGMCLEKYSRLIVKTQDAYVALYLNLDK